MGKGLPMESKVLRPMTIVWPVVVRLKKARSSGKRQGRVLLIPIPPLRSVATTSVKLADMMLVFTLRLAL